MDFQIISPLTVHLTSQYIAYGSGFQLNVSISAGPVTPVKSSSNQMPFEATGSVSINSDVGREVKHRPRRSAQLLFNRDAFGSDRVGWYK